MVGLVANGALKLSLKGATFAQSQLALNKWGEGS